MATEEDGQQWTKIKNSSGEAVPVSDAGGSITVDGTVTANAGSGFPSVQTEDAAASGGETGTMVLGVRNDAAASKTSADGDFSAIATDAAGRVGIADLGGSITVDGTVTTTPSGTQAVNLTQINGSAVGNANPLPISDAAGSITVDGTIAATQSGTWTVQPGNTANTTAWKVDASSVAVPVTDNSGSLTVDNGGTFAVQDSQVIADNAGFTDGTSKVFPAGFVFDETAGTALTENDAAAARIDSKRAMVFVLEDETTRGRRATVTAANAVKVDGSAATQPVSGNVTPVASATGTGLSVQRSTALQATAVVIKASAGRMYGYHFFNPNTSTAFVHVYNVAAASVTVGTTTPVVTYAIPSTATSPVGLDNMFDIAITFDTAMSFAATTTIGGNTSPTTGLLAQVFYI